MYSITRLKTAIMNMLRTKELIYWFLGVLTTLIVGLVGFWLQERTFQPELEIKDLFVDLKIDGEQPEQFVFKLRGGVGMEVRNNGFRSTTLKPRISPEGTVIFHGNKQDIVRVPGKYQISQEIIDVRDQTIGAKTSAKPAIETVISTRAPTTQSNMLLPAVYVYKIQWVHESSGELFYNQCFRHIGYSGPSNKGLLERIRKESEILLPCDKELQTQ